MFPWEKHAALQAVGKSPHTITPCQIPENHSSSNYVRAQQKPKTFQGLWSLGLICQRLTYRRVSSWWVDTLNFNCLLLLLWHGHQQRHPPIRDLTGKRKSRRKWGTCLTRFWRQDPSYCTVKNQFPYTIRAESLFLSLFSGSWPASTHDLDLFSRILLPSWTHLSHLP